MIFYFSGTGNSFYAAKSIAKHNDEYLISIAEAINSGKSNFEYDLKENEIIGFVFPVYAWGPPKIVIDFIEKLVFNNYKGNYIFSLATCGENIGETMKLISSALKKKDLMLHSAFSLIMPNNYIIIGDVDSKEVENNKLYDAEDALKKINNIIAERKRWVFELNKGSFSSLRTSVIHTLFIKGAVNTRKFYADDKCTGCGICERVCNCNNIKVFDKPQWGNKCTQCLACIHYCPSKAVQYGKSTEKKGRYRNPNVSLGEMMRTEE